MLTTSQVPLSQSALLVVDVQDSFKVGPRWSRRNNLNFEANISKVIDAYRAAHLPVYFFLHTDGDEGFGTDHPAFKLMDFLSPRADEPLLIKDTRSCFASTTLQSRLLHQGVRRVAVTGISMEQCCETTTRAAADLGFAVDFVLDATLTFPIPNPDKPGDALSVEAIQERTVYVLRNRFARIITADALVAELSQIQVTAGVR